MKTYWGSEGIAPRILELGTRWRWVVSFTPRPLYLQSKSPWYPLDRRMDEPQNRSGRCGEEKNSQSPPGIEPYNSACPIDRWLRTVKWLLSRRPDQDVSYKRFGGVLYHFHNYRLSIRWWVKHKTSTKSRDPDPVHILTNYILQNQFNNIMLSLAPIQTADKVTVLCISIFRFFIWDWVPEALSLGIKRPGREADHSSPSSAEVKEWVELYLHSPNTPSWRGAQLKHSDNFTFTFLGLLICCCPRGFVQKLWAHFLLSHRGSMFSPFQYYWFHCPNSRRRDSSAV
jgi:hypothetical protein